MDFTRGHIDKGETPAEAVNREIGEELGVKNFFKDIPVPFLFTIIFKIILLEHQSNPCESHYDIWYLVPTNGINFNIDQSEFYDTKRLTIEEAKIKVTESSNIKALNVVEKYGKESFKSK